MRTWLRRVGESELLGGVWEGGWKKETLEGYSKAHSLNSHTDLYAFCHPPPLTCQSLVMFLNDPKKGGLSALCTHSHIPRNTSIMSKCTCSHEGQVVIPQELKHLTSIGVTGMYMWMGIPYTLLHTGMLTCHT